VGAGHVHALFVHGESRLHRVAPQCKVAATFLFVLAVVSTPREAFWAFGAYAALLTVVTLVADLSPATVVRRLVIQVPFLAFALFLPFVGQGPQVEVAGMALSVDGLWGAWNIVAKGTLGVAATVIMAATTPVPEILHGLERLRLPRVITAITGFMVRYLDLTVEEARRMSIARLSRGHDPRWIWQARAVATSAGTLFIRSFERGERVHLAMVSRGYDGALPSFGATPARPVEWAWALTVPASAAAVSMAAWWWVA
jgi:cobalt/nickel transport system permease protein